MVQGTKRYAFMKKYHVFTVLALCFGGIFVVWLFLSSPSLRLSIKTLIPSMGGILDNAESEEREKGIFSALSSLLVANISGFSGKQEIIPELLGFQAPRYYLLLFQNHNELRPTGGFIGSFAVVRVFEGKPTFLWVDDSYNLDRFSEGKISTLPPQPIQEYLHVSSWYFRDANWALDFQDAAQQTLFLFQEELQRLPVTIQEIPFDGVIAITPVVIEELLIQLGDIHVNDEIYSAQDFTEKLQYRVEYEYVQFDEERFERKQIIGVLAKGLAEKFEEASLVQKLALIEILFRMLQEKQILISSKNPMVQAFMEDHHWGGRVAKVDDATDYLFIADANLASLKTDAKIKRSILYTVREQNKKAVSKVQITYRHEGIADWKTTRYRTYSRVVVPQGAVLQGVWQKDEKDLAGTVLLPIENYDVENVYGKEVIGLFLMIEPQESRTIVLQYVLPDAIQDALQEQRYVLFVQKQPGTLGHNLTIDINAFGVIQSWNTDLRVDREFVLSE